MLDVKITIGVQQILRTRIKAVDITTETFAVYYSFPTQPKITSSNLVSNCKPTFVLVNVNCKLSLLSARKILLKLDTKIEREKTQIFYGHILF